jgi:prepilin-type N-terminal cleavage/methylation domain-containing protein
VHVGERRARGFTLLELGIVVLIIAILTAIIIPVVATMRARAQRAKCANNLRNLAVAGNLYIQQHGSWPQIPPASASGPNEEFAAAWIAALAPFNAERETWICPTIQNLMGNPDITDPDNPRVDYIATPFDDKPITPSQWPRQPWFIERGAVHGSGNLIIFTDGSISDLNTVVAEAQRKR